MVGGGHVVFAPFFLDNSVVGTRLTVGLSRIQKLFSLIILAAVVTMTASLAILISGPDSSEHWRRDRNHLLDSLREEIAEFYRRHELELAYFALQDSSAVEDPIENLSAEWVYLGKKGDVTFVDSVNFLHEKSGEKFYGAAVPLKVLEMVRTGTERLGGNIFIAASTGNFITHSNLEMTGSRVPEWLKLNPIPADETWTRINSPDGKLVSSIQRTPQGWYLGYYDDVKQMSRNIRIIVAGHISVLIFLLTVMPLILYYGHKNFITPLKVLSSRARTFADGSPVLIRDRYKIRELDDLAISVNDMMDAVTSREESLRLLNETLEQKVRERTDAHEKTIETLQNARNQLLLTEKMAALGSLVSGVAHEINTPLSIGVTAASFLNERINSIYRDWDSQVLTQENLERFLKDSDEASSIVQNNLDHAAKILNSLKQVAVDQQLDERREFELGSYINDILLSLKHQLRPGKHQMKATSDGVILVYTFPGAIIQILNNLVFNSITHGFNQKEGGRINISSRVGNEEVIMVYEDNGRGLSNEEYERIFELYFTTRRGTGGSGLGMNIVFNLVTEKLNGQIEITPPANGGSGFTIRFPKITGGDI